MVPVKKRGDVREASIEEARAIIQDSGIEALSLREVSRRLVCRTKPPTSTTQAVIICWPK
jgi:AcrR family transcriptional regulator